MFSFSVDLTVGFFLNVFIFWEIPHLRENSECLFLYLSEILSTLCFLSPESERPDLTAGEKVTGSALCSNRKYDWAQRSMSHSFHRVSVIWLCECDTGGLSGTKGSLSVFSVLMLCCVAGKHTPLSCWVCVCVRSSSAWHKHTRPPINLL